MGSTCPQVCVKEFKEELQLVNEDDRQFKPKLQFFQRQLKMDIFSKVSLVQFDQQIKTENQFEQPINETLNQPKGQVQLFTKGNQKNISYKGFLITWKPQKQTANMNIVQGFCTIRQQKTNRIVFQGQFKNSMKNGYGVQFGLDGKLCYEGTFKNDKYDGWGKNQNYYGQFRNGFYDGWGYYKSSNELYCGQLKEGRYDGMGICITGNNLKNIPDLPLKQFFLLLLDKGMSNLSNYNIQQVYTGFWNNGVKSGEGKLWRPNQYWYSGQFSQNSYHGIGALHDPIKDSAVIQGAFKNGQFFKKQ